MKAAGSHDTHRRKRMNIARPDRTGLSVSATFSVATGPKIQVIGANGIPTASTLVIDSRLTPCG